VPAARPGAAAPRSPAAAAQVANASRRFDPVNAAPKRLRLGRSSRLAQSRDFARVRQTGERLAQGCLIANWSRLPAGAASKIGVVTSKKIGGAVVRSRARRLLRESFRLHQFQIAPVELVLVARNSITEKDFAGVERDFLSAMKRGGLVR
jgi:ribonuclease P protein component